MELAGPCPGPKRLARPKRARGVRPGPPLLPRGVDAGDVATLMRAAVGADIDSSDNDERQEGGALVSTSGRWLQLVRQRLSIGRRLRDCICADVEFRYRPARKRKVSRCPHGPWGCKGGSWYCADCEECSCEGHIYIHEQEMHDGEDGEVGRAMEALLDADAAFVDTYAAWWRDRARRAAKRNNV